MDKFLHDLVDGALALLGSILPSALGATVSLSYETGLTWGQRALRLWVGVTVSYFVMRAGGALFDLHLYVLQAVAFLLGLIAYRAAPAFIDGTVAAIREAPALIRDRLLAFLPSKKEKK